MAMRRPTRKLIEPKRNYPCPCGSGAKFKHCCGPEYRDLPTPVPVRAAIDRGDAAEALRLARREFTRYVIWYRSHTQLDMERGWDVEEILRIDIRALGELLSRLRDCHALAGMDTEFGVVLEHVWDFVDDERWHQEVILAKGALGRRKRLERSQRARGYQGAGTGPRSGC
jgi:hypothetical protein